MAGRKGAGQPLLSICIPTYNRAERLGRLLANIYEEIAGLGTQVEICISDNCSTDGTQAAVHRWEKKLPISSRRNGSNKGLDVNFVQAVTMAGGEWAWMCGDDDIFEKGAIARMLGVLATGGATKAGAIYVNAMTKRGPMAQFPFESFRLFSAGEKKYPPINASFAGSLCVRSGVARKVIGKCRVQGSRLIKPLPDKSALDYFAPAWMFLECVKESGWLGIEPECGVRIKADGDMIPFEKKMYLDVTLTLYALEVRRLYAWFNEGARNYNVKSLLVGAAIAAKRPALEEAYVVSSSAHLKLLELEGRKPLAFSLKALRALVMLPVFKHAVAFGFGLMRRMLRLNITDEESRSAHLKESLAFAIARSKRIMAELG